jgi:hypothetical protein
MKDSITSSNESTAVATAQTFTQADIPSLLARVNAQIKELSKGDKSTPTITVGLPGFGIVGDMKDVATILQAFSSVEGKLNGYNAAADKYLSSTTKVPVFRLNGHTAKEWLDVLQVKLSEVVHAKELAKLNAVKTTLESNLSQEMKLANDLKKINEILNEES